MGSQHRFRNNLASQERVGMPSGSVFNISGSVMSEEEAGGSVAVLWGTNFDVNEVEMKTKKFIRDYRVLYIDKAI